MKKMRKESAKKLLPTLFEAYPKLINNVIPSPDKYKIIIKATLNQNIWKSIKLCLIPFSILA